jgi:hypothetical protein
VSQRSSGSPRKCFSDLKADRWYSGAKRHSKARSFINCRAATAAVCARFTRFRHLPNGTISYAFRSKTRHSPQSTHAESRSIHLRLFRRNRRRTEEVARGLAARCQLYCRLVHNGSLEFMKMTPPRRLTDCTSQNKLPSLAARTLAISDVERG